MSNNSATTKKTLPDATIDQKIVGFRVVTEVEKEGTEAQTTSSSPLKMNETIKRPDFLLGSTYKIKPPVADHAMYITINDIVLNEDTDHETRLPYEVFINSKSMEHYQWVIALTRVISAVFRKGGDVTFLVEELSSVYDPNGGYYKKGGLFMPSLVAEIAAVLEIHLKTIGLLKSEEMSETTKMILKQKREQYEASNGSSEPEDSQYPESATMCTKCRVKAVIVTEGCKTCLSCGDSRC